MQADPSLAGTAVEELLRYDSPVQATGRTGLAPFEFQGVSLQPGAQVAFLLGAANHDPAVFDAPHELDLTRADNRHLAFGGGIHYCLGAPLARLEGQVAFRALTRRFPDLSLTGETLVHKDNYTLRGLEALPLALG